MSIPTKFGFSSRKQCIETLEEVAPKFLVLETEIGSDLYGCMTSVERYDLAIRRVSTELADAWTPEVEEFWNGSFYAFREIVKEILWEYVDNNRLLEEVA